MTFKVEVVTLFPEMFDAITKYGITSRALQQRIYDVQFWNPRDFTTDNHKTVDDRPYGGGPGMVMLAEPLEKAINAAKDKQAAQNIESWVIHLSPAGKPLTHEKVMQLSKKQGLVLLTSRYEGVDQRLIDAQVDEELSIGDYVLSGGELPAMALIDAIVRQLPGSLGDSDSAIEDSFVDGLLDCPHYTRPEQYNSVSVPDVLTSGNHAKIKQWRLKMSLQRTRDQRPDLLAARPLTKEEARLLKEIEQEQALHN
ncbi:MAG: tRNA (guanosine(37)-N1)-methyltransferase TrmD [Methylotenera sp.]|nr:tRNA (guanosine(37)-N1)-methyltransferase TrmD [Methylotenera sp.]MDP1960171.1 tRNA (guanosine(37)-N1)-methyltransferase TrmD [Methylotenera sp.]MDP3206670.1 tRNA (guanosine(37)-N1)-methyltransferase TrmD [Methylotenera sp.]MDP3303184.1 tRNA (guanosine(37)-N1)-methyltransferase TrmD [Methylotenera sp.]MDP3943832.1 tRNA (guanosine(37)-N1)-methyltransferase TrmD [Methylotenera sp.]